MPLPPLFCVQVLAFLDSEDLRTKIDDIVDKDELSNDEKLLIRRYITVNIVYRNAQRPGAVINMTLSEFEGRRRVESSCGAYHVVSVKEHKTAALYGSARVILQDKVAELTQIYIVSFYKQSVIQ